MGQYCSASSESLAGSTYENTQPFSLEGCDVVAKVVDIYDGDTLTCVFYKFKKCYRFTVRLAGIDTCELSSKNREQGLRARMRLYELVSKDTTPIDIHIPRKNLRQKLGESRCLVRLICGKFDKYGRLLVQLYEVNGIKSVNDILVVEKLAYPYFGEKKLTDDEQIEFLGVDR
jgi:endonuclease YncB( thermonuclease family)